MAPKGLNPGPEVEDRRSETGGESYLRSRGSGFEDKKSPYNGKMGQAGPESGRGRNKEDDMKKLVQFIKESYAELRKVIWPSREDVISSVKVVIISTVIVAAVLGLVDVLLLFGIRAIF
jgi:preprotein translocase subunit SecE